MNVAITGAGKGIGLDLVRFFLSSGARVWACSRNVSALDTIDSNLLTVRPLDLTKASEADIYNSVAALSDKLDILIHNAAILINRPFQETSHETWQQTFETNVFSAVKVSRALIPLLKNSSAPHIIHIGSMGGFQGSSKFPGLSAYSASKAALASLTECMAEELKSDGIHVNCLALGAVDTEMLRTAFPGYQAPVSSEEMARFIGEFSINQRTFFNGKIIPVSSSTP
jgi:NAD(P)-dependent dehydrogenase (short-subunit alcohol dehydrogenase family)